MRKLILATAVSMGLVTTQAASAEWANKPIQCDTPEEIIAVIKKYEEQPLLGGIGNSLMPSGQVIEMPTIWFVNPDKGTWTLVEFNMPARQACIINSGSKMKYNFDDVPFLRDLLGTTI